MPLKIRTIAPDELEAFSRCQNMAFGNEFYVDSLEHRAELFEFDRNLAAVDGANIVGTAGIFSFEMGVPGGVLPTAGVTMVSVKPTHRRRGILTALMAAQLEQVSERGESIAALWASEASIYGRFGYGQASEETLITIPRVHARVERPVSPQGTFRHIDGEEAARILPAVWDAMAERHAGFMKRPLAWWKRVVRDSPQHREGFTSNFFVTYEVGGAIHGYVRYRTKGSWDAHDLPTGKVKVEELISLDGEAYSALWQYVFGLDLVDTITAPFRRSDEPLYHQFADSRRMLRDIRDGLWIRVVDVEAALAGRRYSTEGRLTIQVTDSFRPAASGTYVLEGGPDEASCQRSSVPAEVSMSIADLGAVYLGGTRVATLAEAGRITGERKAVATADLMFQSSAAPWCPMMF